jgi:hypothetical protein
LFGGRKLIYEPARVEIGGDGRVKVDIQAALGGRALMFKPETYESIASGRLTNLDALIHTATKGYRDVELYLNNLSASERNAQISIGDSGSITDANSMLKNTPLPGGYRGIWRIPVLSNGTKVRGLASATLDVRWELWGIAT